jgi:Helicase HerA, central domain
MTDIANSDIAVVGSPSTNTHLTLDLLQEAVEDRLVGALVSFDSSQDGHRITTVGQIVGIELKNRWHEDSVFRNLIKRTGEIPPITSRQDTRTAELVAGATFRQIGEDGFDPDVLGMVPSTGTRVARVDQALLDRLLAVYRDELFYLGRAYANDVLYPMWFKHFGSGERGAGEAYHFGVFGKTGSGKSGLAKMLMLAYARHPELGILVIDPQGEFSFELAGRRVGEQGLPVDDVLKGLSRPVKVYRIGEIQLEGWDLFEELFLARKFVHDVLAIRGPEHQRLAGELLVEDLRSRTLGDLGNEDGLRAALTAINNRSTQIYTAANRATVLQQRIAELLANHNGELDAIQENKWKPLCNLFAAGSGKRKLYGIVNDLMESGDNARPVVSIDISEQNNPDIWTEELQKRILSRLLGAINARASKTLGESANVLVVLDEAHRHAPSGSLPSGSQAEVLRTTLRRAVRETRKFGIGWFLISQTLGGIDGELIKQLRILFFGFGLALGDEFRKLGEFAGGDKRSMELYQSFRDPHSAPRPDLREFPWMAVGPVSPLSHAGKPVFFSAFTDSQEFLSTNNLSTPSSS